MRRGKELRSLVLPENLMDTYTHSHKSTFMWTVQRHNIDIKVRQSFNELLKPSGFLKTWLSQWFAEIKKAEDEFVIAYNKTHKNDRTKSGYP